MNSAKWRSPGADGFRKSSYSSTGTGCVEVCPDDNWVMMRDSKALGAGPVLRFTSDAFAAFIDDIKDGRYDGP